MYPSMSKEYEKSPPPSAPPAPPPYSQPPVTGIPVTPPTNYQYVDHHQPPPQFPSPINPSSGSGNWSTGLCDCCSDCSTCCLTCWLPCVTFGRVAEIVDKGSTPCVVSAGLYGLLCYFTGCACIYSGFYRNRMRRQYMLPESPCPDSLFIAVVNVVPCVKNIVTSKARDLTCQLVGVKTWRDKMVDGQCYRQLLHKG